MRQVHRRHNGSAIRGKVGWEKQLPQPATERKEPKRSKPESPLVTISLAVRAPPHWLFPISAYWEFLRTLYAPGFNLLHVGPGDNATCTYAKNVYRMTVALA